MKTPLVSIVGKTNSGKTTVIEKLLPELVRRGYRVATIKHHAHKDFEIDIPGKTLDVRLSAEEIQQRLATLPDFEPKIKSGYLARYATMVSNADKGAVFPR